MSNRKRINITIDPETYERLHKIKRTHGFNSICGLVAALVHILLDRIEWADKRDLELPEDNGQYIDKMFYDFGQCERTPDGDVPVRRHAKRIK